MSAQDKPLVLVVDDDPSVRRALKRLIRANGFDVRTFANAEAFRAYERPERVVCLILDIRLPGTSGIELQRELAAARNRPLPVILITGNADDGEMRRAHESGAAAVLLKPFQEQELLDAVLHAVGLGREL